MKGSLKIRPYCGAFVECLHNPGHRSVAGAVSVRELPELVNRNQTLFVIDQAWLGTSE